MSKRSLAWATLLAASSASLGQIPLRATTDTQQAKPASSVRSNTTDTLHLVVGHSLVLNDIGVLKRVYVGNPAILQSFTSSPTEVVLTAKIVGISSLVIWDTGGKTHVYTVAVDFDPEQLRTVLKEAYPNSALMVESREGRLCLSGDVPTQEVADGALRLASSYARDVVNSLRVVPVHPRQVELKLRIIEVDRSKLEQFGVNLFAPNGSKVGGLTTGQYSSVATYTAGTPGTGFTPATPASISVNNPLNIWLYSFAHNIGATIQDLEQKQVLQVLAEPTLTALSGQSAKFLSGGEFPFPVVQGGTGSAVAVTISFRSYGVKMDFTPTVNEDGSIRLKVAPEVSTLDYTNSVTISGFTIPAISTRRAETEVELRSGQSFALSGLLDHRTTESLNQIPGISNVPILGKLFVSKQYNHSVVELVVLVTATVVDPLSDSTKPQEPAWVVPNLDSTKFDEQLRKEKQIPFKSH